MSMDKHKLSGKRQILFQEGKSVEEIPSEETKELKPKKHFEFKTSQPINENIGGSVEERTISIYKWLSTHRLVNLNKLCEICGIDRANFIKGVAANRVIKQDILEKFEETLKSYGYGK